MGKKILEWTIIGALIIPFVMFIAVLMLKVPIKPENELLSTEGLVIDIYEGGVKDVCFRMDGDANIYYINRGLENGLSLEMLKKELFGKRITVKYPEHWLMQKARTIHLSILRSDGKTYFNETI